jgi:DNA-binding protein YbaB
MTALDFDGRRLLERYQDREGADALQLVPDATGTDPSGQLSVVLDAARRVRRVRIADDRGLRDSAAFRAALVAAYADADAHRGAASLEASGHADDWMRRATELINGVRTIHGGTPPSVRREDALNRRATRADHSTQDQTRTGRSDHGYLQIARNERGDVVALDVDAGWLAGARLEHLERAIEQAFDTERNRL